MNLLPIVARELRTHARRRQTYHGRVVLAGISAVCGLSSVYGMLRVGGAGQAGTALFSMVAGLTAMVGMFGAAGATADCISAEKREGTLGLLFLTSLRAYEIVLAKLAANVVVTLFGVLTVVPILGLAVFLGGVRMLQVAAMAAALLNTVFFSGALGLLMSCLMRRADHASGAAVGGAMFFWMGCPGLAQLLNQAGLMPGLAFTLRMLSPQYAFELALAGQGARSAGFFLNAWMASHCLAWLFLGLACVILPRTWQDRPSRKSGLTLAERWAQRRLGRPALRAEHRAAALAINPFFWLVAREPRAHRLVWVILGGLVVLYGVMVAMFRDPDMVTFCSVTLAASLHLILRVWLANEGSSKLATERHQGTLELILSTPLKVEDIVVGQRHALARMFTAPIMAMACLDLVLYGVVVRVNAPFERPIALGALVLASLVVFLLDVAALFWVALWSALTEKRLQNVAGQATMRILFLPFLGIGVAVSVIGMLNFVRPGPPVTSTTLAILWFVCSVLNSLIWWKRCRRLVMQDFRHRAFERYLAEEASPAWWRRAWMAWRSWGKGRKTA